MSSDKSLLRRFFGGIWSVFSFIYRTVIILLVVIVLIAVFGAIGDNRPAQVDEGIALAIIPSGSIVDQDYSNPFEEFLQEASGDPPTRTLLRDLIEALDAAADDSRIKMAALKLDGMWGIGAAQAAELGAALQRFKAAGKPVYTYDMLLPQSHYQVAAHSDELAVDPMGGIWIEGYSIYNNYFAKGLEKLGITMEIFRVGEFKSAIEPFQRQDMSDAARLANANWLGDLWKQYGARVEQARGLDAGAINAYVAGLPEGMDRRMGDAAGYAQEHNLVTQIEPLQAFRERAGQIVGMDEDGHGSFRQIHHDDYLSAIRRERQLAAKGKKQQIGLVVVQGEIVDGYGDESVADAFLVADLLSQAAAQDSVKAVVLRVNSPGGSVTGSERIRRAVLQVREQGKPVVVSMGNMAASGGYWVSMDANRIFAHPSTITGSIGIFGLIPTFQGSLDKLGINTDGLGTTELAGGFRADRGLSDAARGIIQREIEFGYRKFIDGVAQGRAMAVSEVEALAQGRVWSGEDALQLGLVDEIGGLEQAIAHAASISGLSEGQYKIEEFAPQPSFAERLLGPLFGEAGALGRSFGMAQLARELPPLAAAVNSAEQNLRWLRDPRGVYAHCLCAVEAEVRTVPRPQRRNSAASAPVF